MKTSDLFFKCKYDLISQETVLNATEINTCVCIYMYRIRLLNCFDSSFSVWKPTDKKIPNHVAQELDVLPICYYLFVLYSVKLVDRYIWLAEDTMVICSTDTVFSSKIICVVKLLKSRLEVFSKWLKIIKNLLQLNLFRGRAFPDKSYFKFQYKCRFQYMACSHIY